MSEPKIGLWDILNRDYLVRLVARAPAEASQDPWAFCAKEIMGSPDSSDSEREQRFLDRMKLMLSTGSAAERRQTADTVAHYFGADAKRLIAYLKTNGAIWKGLPKDA